MNVYELFFCDPSMFYDSNIIHQQKDNKKKKKNEQEKSFLLNDENNISNYNFRFLFRQLIVIIQPMVWHFV